MWQKIRSFLRNDDPLTQIKWSLYGRVWRECGLPYWKWLVAGVICTVLAACAEGYSVTLIGKIVDKGIAEQKNDVLLVVGLQVIAAFSLKSAFGYAKTLTMAKAGLLGVSNLRRRIYKHMVHQPMAYFHGEQTGPMTHRFTGLANAVLNLVTDNVITIVQSTATLVIMCGLMLWHAPQMTLILLFLTPGILIPLTIIIRSVLRDVSLEIQPGTICAFVGPSGGGKTTIFNLIGRFYDPQQGGVLINGEDIRKFTL